MKIEQIDTKFIKPYSNNNKLHDEKQVKLLAKQIQNHGFDVPIVVDKDMVIIKGHGRLLAAKQLNMTKVPCIIRKDLDDNQIKAARIADNKLSESPWDTTNLLKELDDLRLQDFDCELVAMDSWELPSLSDEDDFKPDLSDKTESNPEKSTFKLIVTFNNADDMQLLFDDLNSQGYKVKVG